MKGYLNYVGMSDRVLFLSGGSPRVGWVGFFDWDLPYYRPQDVSRLAEELRRSIVSFRSGNGYHFMALDIHGWECKVRWFDAWTKLLAATGDGLKSDYILQRDNVLRINAKNGRRPQFEELFYVGSRIGSGFHLRRIRRNCGILGDAFAKVSATWTPRLATQGRIKLYSSDPNGIFDVVAREISSMPTEDVNTGESGEAYDAELGNSPTFVRDETKGAVKRDPW